MNDWLVNVSPNFTDTENAKLTYTGKRSMSEWELEEESGQQWLDALGGTFTSQSFIIYSPNLCLLSLYLFFLLVHEL